MSVVSTIPMEELPEHATSPRSVGRPPRAVMRPDSPKAGSPQETSAPAFATDLSETAITGAVGRTYRVTAV